MGVSVRIDFSELEKFINGMGYRLSVMPNSVKRELIAKASDSVLKQVKIKANTMLKGSYYMGTVAARPYIDTKHMNELEPYSLINFKGTTNQYFEPRRIPQKQRRNGKRRVAEIAFLNEYGVPKNPNQPPRNFLGLAMEMGILNAMDELIDLVADFIEMSIAI